MTFIRDNFSRRTIDILSKRVGGRCSNPACRKHTYGANLNPCEYTNIGVAAHICAAAPGGPRFDPYQSSEERKSIHNGIWLCQSCSKLIDSDERKYTVDLLQRWKRNAEEAASLELETMYPADCTSHDAELIRFYVQCLDRPAFRDDIYVEFEMEDFDKAIEDTIIAFNTGILRTRDGDVIKEAEGKSAVTNPDWRDKLYNVVDILTTIRRRLIIAERDREYCRMDHGQEYMYCFRNHELAEWLNRSREEVLKIMASICNELGIHGPVFPRRSYRW